MPLRISGGEFKGHRIDSPKPGRGIRPTTEKVKLALFSIIGPSFMERCRVLDLYSCSGALGIESLSRGAESAVFVEKLRRNCALIKKNLRTLGIEDKGMVINSTVKRFLDSSSERFDFVILDPPFDHNEWENDMSSIGNGFVLEPDGFVVGEHRSGLNLKDCYGRLKKHSSRRYGGSILSIYKVVN